MKKLKIFSLLFMIVGMFFVSSLSISASSEYIGYPVNVPSDVHVTEEYPYLYRIRQNVPGSKYSRYEIFILSSKPIVIESSEHLSNITFNGFFFQFDINFPSNPIYTDYKNSTLGFGGDYEVIEFNHDIFDTSGNLVFHVPLLTDQVVSPLVEATKANSQAIMIGLISCLAVLVISSMVLPKVLRKFSNS